MSTSPISRTLIHPSHRSWLEPASRLHATNPFAPDWDELMRAALGASWKPEDVTDNARRGTLGASADRLAGAVAAAVAFARDALARGVEGTVEDRAIYQGACLYHFWHEFGPGLQQIIDDNGVDAPFFDALLERYRHLFGFRGITVPDPAQLLSFLYQARRAWYFAAKRIRGRSPSAGAARVTIWQANLGADICVYVEDLYRRIDEIPVLITGETGTGKELAAECIGWSRYIPFDPKARRFARKHNDDFHARNLAAVPRELLESELFGHRRGAFTGATADKTGFFALAGVNGTLFLDEVGEMPEHVQVKLLRPLQSRECVPVGETRPYPIPGRILCATNRDLEARCAQGAFRRDLLERMRGVHVHMPSLRQMLAEVPGDLEYYVRGFVADRIVRASKVEALTARIVTAIRATSFHYAWPGNVRELAKYSVSYIFTDKGRPAPVVTVPASPPVTNGTASHPVTSGVAVVAPAPPVADRPGEEASAAPGDGPSVPESVLVPTSRILGETAKAGKVRFDQLMQAYVSRMYFANGENACETARQTGLDRRTVARWIDPERLKRWRKRKK